MKRKFDSIDVTGWASIALVVLMAFLALTKSCNGQCLTPEKTFLAQDEWKGTDKIIHLGASYSLGFIASSVFYHTQKDGYLFDQRHLLKGGLTALGIGIGKEIFDCIKANPTGLSYKDLAYDSMGIMLGIWSHYILEKYSFCKGLGKFSLFANNNGLTLKFII